MMSRLRRVEAALLSCALAAASGELVAQGSFQRGDANCDGCVNCLDGELILIFLGAPPGTVPLCCADAADADGDFDIDSDDAAVVFGIPPGANACLPPGPLGCSDYPADRCGAPPGDCSPPAAAIDAPDRVLALTGAGVQVLADGRGSKGSRGAPPASFLWAVQGGGSSFAPARPREAVTRVKLPSPGAYTLKLDVSPLVKGALLGDPDDMKCGYAERSVVVVEPNPAESPRFIPPKPFEQVAVAGAHFRLPLLLSAGPPGLVFELIGPPPPDAVPPGLTIDTTTGVLDWDPGIDDVGMHAFSVHAAAGPLAADLSLKLRVLDPGQIAAAYAAPEPVGNGGGAGAPLDPGPLFLEDLGVVPFDADLILSVNGPECAVASVPAQRAIRFDPACDPSNSGSKGKVYSSGTSVAKLSGDVVNDFSIEVWLANVAAAQPVPAGEAAYIFSVSGPGGELDWLLGAKGNGMYAARVKLGAAVETFDVDLTGVNLAGATPHPIVFVRRGSSHKFYADGVERPVTSPNRPGDLSGWNDDLRAHVGNSEDRTRPFAGDLYYCAFYVEALDESLIGFLSENGPFIDESDVPPPIAEVCPDPREIGRIEGDGTQSRAGWEGGNGGGASPSSCQPLRPFTWEARALPSNELLAATPLPGSEDCREKVEVLFDPQGVRGIELKLTVEQTAVREHAPRTQTVTRRIFAFRRGDANADGTTDLSDAVAILNFLFSGGAAPPCDDAADADDSEVIDISDPIRVLNFLFLGAAAPPAPGPSLCGFDGTAAASPPLGCESYTPGCEP